MGNGERERAGKGVRLTSGLDQHRQGGQPELHHEDKIDKTPVAERGHEQSNRTSSLSSGDICRESYASYPCPCQ
jgi:hypothetical protein